MRTRYALVLASFIATGVGCSSEPDGQPQDVGSGFNNTSGFAGVGGSMLNQNNGQGMLQQGGNQQTQMQMQTQMQTATAGTGAPVGAMGQQQTGLQTTEQNPAAGAAGTAAVQPVGNGEGGGEQPAGDCASQGLNLEGLMYSPGGNALPFPCEPFDATTNNPYAVRCIDAWPYYETQYPGDEFCILPPEPGLGIQIGVHPQGLAWYDQVSQGDLSGYDNPSDEFVMRPGDEEERNYNTSAPNDEEIKYYRTYVRMRAGSHHSIVSTGGSGGETWGPGGASGLTSGTSIPGSQRPDDNMPTTLDKPAEDAGLYRRLEAHPGVIFNMHHFNATSDTTLKEAWTNMWFEDDAVTPIYGILGLDPLQVLSMSISPGMSVDYHYSYPPPAQPYRLLSLFGHRHAWTTNFSAWVDKADGSTDILYQSFDWFDQPTYRYDSIAQNPVPSRDNYIDGAYSGMYEVGPGDTLHFNCHIEYTEARAQEVNGPSPAEQGTIRFANQAFAGEMCILFGSTSQGQISGAPGDLNPPPQFAQ